MGSQSLGSISSAKASRIRNYFRQFHPGGADASAVAMSAAANAIGTLAKTSSFVQCLSHESVENALAQLINLANGFRFRNPDQVYGGYQIDPRNSRPFGALVARIQSRLEAELTAQQRRADSASAVADAVPQTVIDILAETVRGVPPHRATRQQLELAFRRTPARTIARHLIKNVVGALLGRTFDAARTSRIPPATVDQLKAAVQERFANQLARRIDQLARREGVLPSRIPSRIQRWLPALEAFVGPHRPPTPPPNNHDDEED